LLGLHGGAIVLTVAAFEQFLTDMFQERLRLLEGGVSGISLSSLPETIQFRSVVGSLELVIHPPRYAARSHKDIISDTLGV
jgi:hypothetical protein